MTQREDNAKAPVGAQTLTRGLRALRLVAQSPTGVTIADLAAQLGVHRSIAYRILGALSEERLIARGPDGRFRGSVGLIHLADGGLTALRMAVQPGLMSLSDEVGTTVSFFVREGDDAVALAVFESVRQGFRMGFQVGERHQLDRGAAGLAIRALELPNDEDSDRILQARAQGYARTHGEVEPNLYGLAVPLIAGGLPCCINIVSNRPDVLDAAIEPALTVAGRLTLELSSLG